LAQEIVASLVFPITEILVIEDNELHNTFLLVAFGSQSLLRITSDLIGSDTNRRTEGGDQRGVNGSLNKFFYKNQPMSQVQTPKTKPYKKLMNIPTNSIKMILSKLQIQWKKNRIN
jgi:hypothetical protein